MNWMTHILTAVILYTSAMGVGLLHGHPHQHDGTAGVHADAHDADCGADDGGEGSTDHEPCSRTDCDNHACCSVHSHHLIAVGLAVPFEPSCTASDFRSLENQIALTDYTHDIFHPPKSC